MAKTSGRSKNVVGLFVDGLDVKLAHLSVHGRKVVVNELRSATLATRMADHRPAEVGAVAGIESSDAFSLSGSADVSAVGD